MSSLKLKSSKVIAMLLAVAMLISMIPVSLLTVFALNTEYFTVTVTDSATGDPIANAEVCLESPNDIWTVTATPLLTDEDGKAEFETSIISDAMSDAGITEASLKVTVTKSGYVSYSESELIQEDNLTVGRNVSLVEREKTTLTGTVTDENGLAYESATVKLTGDIEAETTTDADGNYSFQAYKGYGEYTITATATEEKYLSATTTVSAPADNHTCTTLKFEIKQFTVSTGSGENGTITATDTVLYGNNKEVTATADEFYRIQSFEIDGTPVAEAVGLKSYTHSINNITSAKTVNVTFVRYSYKINFTVSENGEVKYNDGSEQTVAGGSVSIDKEVAIENGTVTVNANPSTNYRVSKVIVDGTTHNFNENDKIYSEIFEINKDHTFEVEFSINQYTVKVNNGENGTSSFGTSGSEVIVKWSEGTKLNITPDSGYALSEITVNGVDKLAEVKDDNGIYIEITNVTENIVVEVEFEQPTVEVPTEKIENEYYTITFSDDECANAYYDGSTYVVVLPNDATATITPTAPYNKVKINTGNANGNYKNSVTITETTLIENVYVKQGVQSSKKKNITVDVRIIIDKKAPVIADLTDKTWTKAESVTINGTVTDETYSSGLNRVVWSKGASLSDAQVIAEVTNKTAIGTNGAYSFDVTEEQNATYYVYAVDNAGNVSDAKTVLVQIDRTIPTVTGFTFEKIQNSAFEEAISFISFGTFFPEKIKVTISVADIDSSIVNSGTKQITLYANGEEVAKADVNSGTATFELLQTKFENAEISATVVDNAGNISVITKPMDENINTNALSNKVYINAAANNTLNLEIGSSVTQGSDNVKYQKDSASIEWYANKNVTLNLELQDAVVGLKNLQVIINGKDITNEEDIDQDLTFTLFNRNIKQTQTLELKTLNSDIDKYLVEGQNTVEITVTNNANISKKQVYKFNIDQTKPDVMKYELKSNGSTALEKVLNFLTFGIFFNQEIEITVTAAENNADSDANVGVKSITLYYGEDSMTDDELDDNKAVFVLPASVINDGFLFSRDISAKATDFVGNITETAVHPHKNNTDGLVEDDAYNLMIEKINPVISAPVLSVNPSTDVNNDTYDNEAWFADGVDVDFTIDISDVDSGIRKVEIEINGTKLTTDKNNINIVEEYNKKSEKTTAVQFVVSTSQVERNDDTGEFTLNITVYDNAGNVSTLARTVYRDEETPYITGFEFAAVDGAGLKESDEKPVEVTDYGYFFKADTKVTISAKDVSPSSGINAITYYTVDYTESTNGVKSGEITKKVSADGKIDFEIKANFKGQIFAKVSDNASNTSAFVNPDNAIVEGADKHSEETHIEFAKPDTNYKDNENIDLYKENVPVTITVTDTYSGIHEIEWEVVADYDKANNKNGTVTVNNNGTFIANDSENCDDAAWEIVKTDSNLVTKLQRTITVKNDSNEIVVKVRMTDRAGNSVIEGVTDDEGWQFITISIDKQAPIMTVEMNDADDDDYTGIFKEDRTYKVTILERNFIKDVKFAVTVTDDNDKKSDVTVNPEFKLVMDGDKPKVTVTNDVEFYTYEWESKFANDGDYTFSISAIDLAENESVDTSVSYVNSEGEDIRAISNAFTVDKTLPEITVVYDNNEALNGNYYKADRIATITIKEHNFDAVRVKNLGVATDRATGEEKTTTFPTISAWKDNGDNTHTATITYNADSKYVFDIEFVDKAGNSIADYTPVEFYIDKTAPTLEISGVADKSANNGTVAPVITYSDTNFDKDAVTITLTGINNGKVDYSAKYGDITNGQTYTYENFEKVQNVDDIYTLTVKLTDKAGNETEKTISFSANRFGSVYDLSQIEDIISKYLKVEEDLVFTETNVDSLDRDGIKIKLTKNGTPSDLVEGTDYTVEVTGGNGQWSVYKYTIKKALFTDDGRYSLSIYSKDAAGNINENIDETKKAEISFGIDKTNPVIVPIDFESGKQYAVDVKDVVIEIKDNLVLENVKIYLNGEEIEYTVDGESYKFSIPKSNSKQDVKIVTTDAAGNEEIVEVNDFLVNTNIFVRWFNNTPLFVGSIIGVVVLALGITIFLVFFKKKKEGEEK